MRCVEGASRGPERRLPELEVARRASQRRRAHKEALLCLLGVACHCKAMHADGRV
jgi:hypothetical protein